MVLLMYSLIYCFADAYHIAYDIPLQIHMIYGGGLDPERFLAMHCKPLSPPVVLAKVLRFIWFCLGILLSIALQMHIILHMIFLCKYL